jgi:hypothetical protein
MVLRADDPMMRSGRSMSQPAILPALGRCDPETGHF